jgi:hypothetical protein
MQGLARLLGLALLFLYCVGMSFGQQTSTVFRPAATDGELQNALFLVGSGVIESLVLHV